MGLPKQQVKMELSRGGICAVERYSRWMMWYPSD